MEVERLDEEQIKNQTRSPFASWKRFRPWFAEVRRPNVLDEKTFTSNGYDTDVEAAVAASVAVRVFEIFVSEMPDPKNCRKPKGSNPPFKCHNYLIELIGWLPESSRNRDIHKYVKHYVELFVKKVKEVENNIKKMPHKDTGMTEAINLYPEAVRYDQQYREGKVPLVKQLRSEENKRKRNLLESEGAHSDTNGPTSSSL